MDDLSTLTDDQLADHICTWAGRVAAGTARLLRLVAEFDRREAWGGVGMLTCAQWLTWRIQLSPGTAREWVRVARRLEELPQIRAAFDAGRMSWSQARAITRVATLDDGVDWVGLARHSSAAQLERIVRGLRRVQQAQEAEADPELVAYRLRTRQRYDAHGNLALTIYAPAEVAPVILAGIEAQRVELERQRAERAAAEPADPPTQPPVEEPPPSQRVPAGTSADRPVQEPSLRGWPEGTTEQDVRAALENLSSFMGSYTETTEDVPDERVAAAGVPAGTSAPAEHEAPAVTDADALAAMARAALDAQHAQHPEVARRNRPWLVPQIDPLSGWGRLRDGELLPPTSLRTVVKALPGRAGVVRLRPLSGQDLTRHDLGRRLREPNRPLRELLGTLDGERCRFPGCTRHRKLHAHHVVFWSQGGRTDLANLVLVCSRHHTLIHTQGFQLVLHPDRRLEVTTAEGVPILHHPAQPWGDPAALDEGVSSEALTPATYERRMDLGYVVSVLLQQAA